ncbi:MAG: restriction endonuclease, partial [Desulfobacteraceae bacterium]|nr:restriction endonuclease [Desulfobacteraceae bacterium]
FQRPDGKSMEMDVLAESDCGRIAAIEVKKWKKPVGVQAVRDFTEKIQICANLYAGKRMVPGL